MWILFWFGLFSRVLGPKTSMVVFNQLAEEQLGDDEDPGEGSHTPDGTVPNDSPGTLTPRTSVDTDRSDIQLLMGGGTTGGSVLSSGELDALTGGAAP